jgi:RHS repeat-associated protein
MSETTSTSTAATPVIAYDYVWFDGQPLAQIENATGVIAWYFNDHLGTPIRQTDATGRVLWQAEYEPYGTIYAIRRGEARHQPLRLPGQTAEEGSDLYQNVFRFYRAGWGRYTQGDPVGLKGGSNLYRYTLNNPVRWFDPLGLTPAPFPSTPTVPPFPRTPPNASCCNKGAMQKSLDSTNLQIKRLMSGDPLEGYIGGITVRGITCEGDWCRQLPVDPSLFSPGVTDKDPCVKYCGEFHEWIHFTDNRPWSMKWTDYEQMRFLELPAYVGEKSCLLVLMGK